MWTVKTFFYINWGVFISSLAKELGLSSKIAPQLCEGSHEPPPFNGNAQNHGEKKLM